jgi:hypothetical protein
MLLESQWPGDALAAPMSATHHQADAFIDRAGHGSCKSVDRRSDRGETGLTASLKGRGESVIPLKLRHSP